MEFKLVQGDITEMEVDALVTGATTSLKPDRGGPRALKYAAGVTEIQAECDQKGPIGLGEAVETDAYDLNAEYVIHAAIREPTGDVTGSSIRDATTNALEAADACGCESIALPVLGKAPLSVESPTLEQRASYVMEATLEYGPLMLTEVTIVSNNDRTLSDPICEVASTLREDYDESDVIDNYWEDKEWEDLMWKDSVLQFGLPAVIHSGKGGTTVTEVLLADEIMRIDDRTDVQVGDTVESIEYKNDGRTLRIEEELPRPDSGYTAYRVSPV